MKYFYYLVLTLGLMCASCSEDDNAIETVKSGSYNYIEGDNVISVYFKDGGFWSILIFTDGEVSFQSHEIETKGAFPEYTAVVYSDGYRVDSERKLDFSAKYNNKTFNVVTSGSIEGNLGKMKRKIIEIPRSLILKYDQSVLDKNGDGILDTKQNL